MVTDHSKTYKLTDLRNVVHVMRLKSILSTVDKQIKKPVITYADFGCSNGYITSQIAERLAVKNAFGFDYSDNVLVGSELHPEINFQRFNLNVVSPASSQYDLVSCFETLEHVGNMESAVQNVIARRAPDGYLLITVPIEIGWIGFIKYGLKRFLFRYDLPLNCTDRQYASALLKGERIGKFRPFAEGYGTHFGFDYRDVDDLLDRFLGRTYRAWNTGSSRFYLVGA